MQLTEKERLNGRVIVLATANQHKVDELRAMLGGESAKIISAAEAGFTNEIEETGTTLEENALLKARAVAIATNFPALADDTGLEVDALNGAPGVYSARFAGFQCSPADNRALLLRKLAHITIENRTARFRCVLAFVDGANEKVFEGVSDGVILTAERGVKGFGYDAVFCPIGGTRSMAEMSPEEKNNISHRGRAVKKFREYLHALPAPNA